MVKKMSLLPCSLFLHNFKIPKFLYDLVFHQVHQWTWRGHVFIVQKIWNQLYEFMHFLKIPLKKKVVWTLDIVSLQDSKWHLHSILELF
jgi:hypothetical protein